MERAGSVATTTTALPHQMTDAEIMREHQRDLDVHGDVDDGGAAYAEGRDSIEISTSGAPCDREPVMRISPEAAAKMPLHKFMQLLRDSDLCGECGKTRAVMNIARRGFTPERVTAETHCACVGGPAYTGIGGTL